LQYKTRAFTDREQQEATEKLAELRRRQLELRLASFAAAAVGSFALSVFLLLINGYQRRLVRQALHDPLTGLPNRELFADRVGQAIRNADRELRPAVLLLLDLDRFKEVNDTLGHHHGDLLLIQVGQRLAGALREADTVARLGGDEFAVLLPGATAEGAGAVADKLRVALQQPLSIDGITLDLDASIGIAVYPEHGNDPAELLQHADVAMYGAKQAHVGFLVYDPTVDQHSPSDSPCSAGYDGRWKTTSWCCTTNPRLIWAPARSTAWRRWCAGSIPNTACSGPANSSHWPNGPGSSTPSPAGC